MKWINFLSEKLIGKIFEKNNVTIALNVLYAEKEKIYAVYLSKHNSNREKQVIPVMILNGEALSCSKILGALLRGITLWCTNCLYSFTTKKRNVNLIK